MPMCGWWLELWGCLPTELVLLACDHLHCEEVVLAECAAQLKECRVGEESLVLDTQRLARAQYFSC